MPRKREGTAIPHDDHWDVRITLDDGSRPVICLRDELEGQSKALARARARSLTEAARAGKAWLPKKDARSLQSRNVLSMSDWFDTWIETRRAKGLTSTRENGQHYREHIVPILGEKHVQDWTADDM